MYQVPKIYLSFQIYLTLAFSLSVQEVLAQPFTPTGDKIIGLTYSSIKWADYDNDGDLDLILSGADSSYNEVTKIYQNVNGQFEEIATNLPQIVFSSIDWGDFDNDGDLDFVVSGSESGMVCPPCLTKIFQNENGTFLKYEAALFNVFAGDARWVDFDNDNDLDLFITGIDDFPLTDSSKLYRNENGRFVDIKAAIIHTNQGKCDWGDYDNDGDLDLLVSGFSIESGEVLKLYRNDRDNFREVIEESFHGIFNGSVSWGDYDNDGDMDILAVGTADGDAFAARIYENQQCRFEPIALDDKIVAGGTAAWGDYDNDSDLDILVSGLCNCIPAAALLRPWTKVYQNSNGVFSEANIDLVQMDRGSLAWADFDNDGDSDFIISGLTIDDLLNDPTNVKYRTILYRNELKGAAFGRNTPPDQPSGLNTVVNGNSIRLSWGAPSDSQTESLVLTYNVYIEDLDRNIFVVSPLSNVDDGYRKIVSPGNAGYNEHFYLENLPTGQYMWSVQAIDNGFLGSDFAQAQLFSITSKAQVPNVITPNGDGINEKFIIGNANSGWSLDVMNRWGNPVHHSEDYKNDWDGNGLSPGIYYYILRNRCGDVQSKGTLTILH